MNSNKINYEINLCKRNLIFSLKPIIEYAWFSQGEKVFNWINRLQKQGWKRCPRRKPSRSGRTSGFAVRSYLLVLSAPSRPPVCEDLRVPWSHNLTFPLSLYFGLWMSVGVRLQYHNLSPSCNVTFEPLTKPNKLVSYCINDISPEDWAYLKWERSCTAGRRSEWQCPSSKEFD